VELSFAATDGLIQLDGRRRLLLSALAAIIVLVAVGTALIARARHSEMVLARLQSDFVTAVSHEFRTPLTALRQFNELLDDPELASPQQRRNYQRAQTRATQRLHRLVESLLDFGRMQAGKRPYTWQLVDARSLVSDVVDEFRGELGDCEIVVRANDLDEWLVRADSDALARALWNLLDNAVKYSGDGRTIFVTVERVANWISISVRDNGIGIPQDEQSRIFQKFTRGAAAQARRIRGTGIGLAMVQHIVSAHGGVISLQSVEGEGSTFTMRIHGIAPRLATDNSTEPQPVRDVRTSSTGLP
jgi:signal transduction histidine kinase